MDLAGVGMTLDYQVFLIGDGSNYSYAELILADQGRIRFDRISPGTGLEDAVMAHTATPTSYYARSSRTRAWRAA